MPAPGTTVGSLEIDAGGSSQEAKCLRGCRHGDAEGRTSENLAVRTVADADALRVHLGFVCDLPAVARAFDSHGGAAVPEGRRTFKREVLRLRALALAQARVRTALQSSKPMGADVCS
jgi:hypothetical protein